MKQTICRAFPAADAYIVPCMTPPARTVSLGEALDAAIDVAIAARFDASTGAMTELTLPVDGRLATVILFGLGEALPTPRKLYVSLAKAFRRCKELGARSLAFALDNAPALRDDADLFETVCRLPELVNYTNVGLKTNPSPKAFEEVSFVTAADGLEARMLAAADCARGTVYARLLTNEPASVQTPESLGEHARRLGSEYGFDVEILHQPEIEEIGMKCFLSVARAARNTPPVVIVMRHMHGGDAPTVAFIGKGIVYDSGGYCLKSNANMKNMFDDMAGAGAVIGAMTAIAKQNLPVNVIGVIAACENRISFDAYGPGDVIGSMSGKTIEVGNTDAEGRLTLADAVTFAIQKEKCDVIVDIASLTGAAKGAVGKYSSAVMCSDDALFDAAKAAAFQSCEKIWRLDTDCEMAASLDSAVADIRNVAGPEDGGGCIVAGLFIQAFTEKKPWLHIDMAGVNYRAEAPAFSSKGATGYGAALLFYLARNLNQYFAAAQEN